MSVPTSYTEAALKAYMHSVAGGNATLMGWTVDAGSYDEAVNSALMAYGEDTIGNISGMTSIAKLRAFAVVELWRMGVNQCSVAPDFSADNTSVSRAGQRDSFKEKLDMALSDAMQYGYSGYEIGVERGSYIDSPYQTTPLAERVL